MSEPHDADRSHPPEYSSLSGRGPNYVNWGGALGIAAACMGLAIFLFTCAGFGAALNFSLIPLLLAAPGLILSIVGGVQSNRKPVPDTHVLAAVFVNVFALIGAVVEVAAWAGWRFFV